MKAYKCDRCGSYYDKYVFNNDGLCLVHPSQKPIDLCPECNNELSKWYKNEQEQEDIPECKYCRWTGSPEPIGKCVTCVRGSNFEASKTFVTTDEDGNIITKEVGINDR